MRGLELIESMYWFQEAVPCMPGTTEQPDRVEVPHTRWYTAGARSIVIGMLMLPATSPRTRALHKRFFGRWFPSTTVSVYRPTSSLQPAPPAASTGTLTEGILTAAQIGNAVEKAAL